MHHRPGRLIRQNVDMDDNDEGTLLNRLETFIGQWTMSAQFPGAPPIGTMGLTTFEWSLEGQFLLQHSEFSEPGPPEGLMIIGPNAESVNYTQHYFDSRGVARLYAMTFDGDLWTLQREMADFTPLDFRQRFIATFSEDRSAINGRWEQSHDGATWEQNFELMYRTIL